MPRGLELDWVVIHVNTVRRGAAIAAVGVVASALVVVAYLRLNLPPDAEARRALERAVAAHDKVVAQPVPEIWREELSQAENQLETARTAYADEKFQVATTQANDARSRFEGLLGASHQTVGVGQFFSLEGRVAVQRAGKAEWNPAHQRMPVFNGDFVKTGRDGSAEILFSDGSMYRIAPNSLLEIHHQSRESEETSGTVKMVVGRINVVTSDSGSTVTTENTETRVERDSRVAVDVDEDSRRTTVAAYSGQARIRNPRGQEVVVSSQETVAATGDGDFSAKRRLPSPPFPLEPRNNAGFELSASPVIELVWRRPSAEGAVHLQVSRSQRFLEEQVDIDATDLKKDRARLKAVSPGTYYWRVATVVSDAMRSQWSTVRRFQVFSPSRQRLLEDITAPDLKVELVQQLGHLFIVEGYSEVGAAVTINGESVELDGDGRFRKAIEVTKEGWNDLVISAVDPSGNPTERRKRVFVEGF